jgi:hypothetical protein
MSKKELIKRGLISTLPASVIMLDYQVAVGVYPALAFCISWGVIMWSCSKLESKDPVMARYYRILSSAFLVMPIAAMIGSGKAASSAAGVNVSEAEKAGAAIGGGIVLVISLMISLPIAAAFHFAAKGRMRKIKEAADKKEMMEFQEELIRTRF